jgi:hypothetical protein
MSDKFLGSTFSDPSKTTGRVQTDYRPKQERKIMIRHMVLMEAAERGDID